MSNPDNVEKFVVSGEVSQDRADKLIRQIVDAGLRVYCPLELPQEATAAGEMAPDMISRRDMLDFAQRMEGYNPNSRLAERAWRGLSFASPERSGLRFGGALAQVPGYPGMQRPSQIEFGSLVELMRRMDETAEQMGVQPESLFLQQRKIGRRTAGFLRAFVQDRLAAKDSDDQ